MDQPYFTASGNVTSEEVTFKETIEVGFASTRTEKGEIGRNSRLIYFEAITGLLALISIFMYKNRPLQLKICLVNFIVMTGVFIMMYDYSFGMEYMDAPQDQRLEYNALIPVALLIFNFLAVRRINADEKLVKSLDRIR